MSQDETENVRVAAYATFAKLGRAPTIPELAAETGLDLATIRSAFAALHVSRDFVLSPDALAAVTSGSDAHDTDPRAIVMAHPFATVPLGFSVMGKDTLWWGGCCWDSFALPHLIPDQAPVLVATRCPGCAKPLALDVGADQPPKIESVPGTTIAHFLMPMNKVWDDVVHTCGNQSLFCAEECLDGWLVRTGHTKGYVMTIDTLWHFAKGWYAGRFQHGYKRREPAQAKDYFRSVGLSGAFWGL